MGSSTPSRTTVTRGGAVCGGWVLSAVEYVNCTPGVAVHRSDQLHPSVAHAVQIPAATICHRSWTSQKAIGKRAACDAKHGGT
eukprot:5806932-Prymnesium_polylepis.1